MSAHPNIQTPADASRLPVTLPRLFEKKRLGEPIVMVTAYDFPSARAAEEAGVDLVLVGDSGAMTVLGYPSTVAVELDELLVLARATRRGPAHALPGRRPALRLLRGLRRAGGADGLPLRQGGGLRRGQARRRRPGERRARSRHRAGRHPGHGPRRPDAADLDRPGRLPRAGPHGGRGLAHRARGARAAGGGLLQPRLRGHPGGRRGRAHAAHRDPGHRHRRRRRPPTARCSSSTTSSGIREGLGARFVKRYASLQDEMVAGVAAYADDVRSGRYPGPEHGYSIEESELAEFREALGAL